MPSQRSSTAPEIPAHRDLPRRLPRLLSGLALAGSLLLSACEEPSDNSVFLDGNVDRTDDVVVATVGGTPVYLTDVQRVALGQERVTDPADFRPDDPDFADVREEVVDQRAMALAAKADNLNLTDEAARRLAALEERMLGNLLVERRLEEAVTEEALRELYVQQDALREPADQVRAAHLLVNTRAEAEAAIARVEGGESFAEVAAELSLDGATAGMGGDLDWFGRDSFAPEFTEAAFATEPGNLSPPVETEFGWHVIDVRERRSDAAPTFEMIRGDLEAFLTYDTIEAVVKQVRADTEVELVDLSTLSLPAPDPDAPAIPAADGDEEG